MERKKILSPRLVARVRAGIEMLYDGLCMVEVQTSEKNPVTKKNESKTVKLYVGIPCRLSHESKEPGTTRTLPAADQTIMLFIAPQPEIEIPPNSRITITQDGVTERYACSSVPNNFPTHQEIELVKWEKWA